MWLLKIWKRTSGTEKVKYWYDFILNHLNLNSDIELAAAILHLVALVLGVHTTPLSDRQGLRNDKKSPSHFIFLRFYLFLERQERRRKKGRETIMCERYIHRLPLTHLQLGTWPRACALTENWTSDLLVHRPGLNPLSHTSQGKSSPFYKRGEVGALWHIS